MLFLNLSRKRMLKESETLVADVDVRWFLSGFHVVVKLLEKLGEEDVEEILGKLCRDAAAVVSMGRDQWGCCVLKACIDTAKGERLQVALINLVSTAVVAAVCYLFFTIMESWQVRSCPGMSGHCGCNCEPHPGAGAGPVR